MADIKTHLRELSVAVGVHCLNNNIQLTGNKITPSIFLDLAQQAISHDIPSAQNLLALHNFDHEHFQILTNGFNLANLICSKFPISTNDPINWIGNDTQQDSPIDLQIGNFSFSLKENSFILKNMGLYELLSCMTGQLFPRGLHVFKEFAPTEYEKWFCYTWSKLIAKGRWVKEYEKYTSSFAIKNDVVEFSYNNTIYKVSKSINDTDSFKRQTNGIIREKVFAKWINDELKHDSTYLTYKKHCSETAGDNLCKFINKNLNPFNLSRLLQIRDLEYYYAKSTNNDSMIIKVPSLAEFTNEIRVESVFYSVPTSQLNIITVLKNIKTNTTLEIRNECRFSHGQLNGTPEAKMYYKKKLDLSVIYTPIELVTIELLKETSGNISNPTK